MPRLIFLLLLLVPLPSWAEIYRWTDAGGQVHFGEQPQPGAERVEVKPQVVERDAATRDSQERLRKLFDAREQEQDAAAQKQAARNARRAEECSKLRQSMAELNHGGLYYSQDASGERIYYSDQQMDAARSRIASQLSANCS
ncbi:DUF4124 domain-containing protein [Pseudomonas sp. N040]|uniref:DUF4124 domain-containing protein n=1 Tax=Pseudomonas sp. N040 TaxID=2785325 RepID=UPI0018A2D31F|nr:DUF4124 domain-containing protein [Pseudomonas sp. N040]MBF7730523.1 DUF4124 domain-containing protein [Pseudomonas sp. N040]MBW7014167.1 DUF4124 domain-containing protein [Pseudomonas sp. N040]